MSSTTEHPTSVPGAPSSADVTAAIPAVPPRRHAAPGHPGPRATGPHGPSAYGPPANGPARGRPAGAYPGRPGGPGWTPPRSGPATGWNGAAPRPAWSPPGPGMHPGGPHPGTPGMRWGWIVIGIVGAILAVAMVGSLASSAATMTVPGTVTLDASSTSVTSGSSCTGVGFQSYVDHGAPVTIYDATGTLVGSGTLGYGTPTTSSTSYFSSDCVFAFTLDDVPADSDFYRVEIGSRSGDGVPFSAAELRSGGADITIGK